MVERFRRICLELRDVPTTDGVNLTNSCTPLFEVRCKKLDSNLTEINTSTKSRQRRCMTWDEYTYYTDTITRTIED